MLRSMTPTEESHLAATVLYRDLMGMACAEWFAAQHGLGADVLDLVRAGLDFEEIEVPLGAGGPGVGYRYEWRLPASTGRTH